jgi:photosystem II stability/assembly factor-like uncharacterized protein
VAGGRDGHLYVTNDAGDHWRHGFGEGTRRVSAAAILGPSMVAGTTVGSIHASEDGGISWHELANLGASKSITCFAPLDHASPWSTVLVGSTNGCVALANVRAKCEVLPAGLVVSTLHHWPRRGVRTSVTGLRDAWREAVFRSEDVGRSWTRHARD